VTVIFWASIAVILYTYAGYAFWLWLRGRLWPLPVERGSIFPRISIIMVVRNEEKNLDRKLANVLAMDYPADLLELVVVSDGSKDGTERILSAAAVRDGRLSVIIVSQSQGKACGLNDAIARANGEITVFTDARQQIEPGALRILMENFSDKSVGCVSGELMIGDAESGQETGLYWRIEKKLRKLESESGSVVGATGAFYAARRELLQPLPSVTILDDVLCPMNIARQGFRVILDERARAWDVPTLGEGREFARKVRTLTGNYQLVQLAPWLLTRTNPLRFEFVSHKLMRLVVPFALALTLLGAALINTPFYRLAFWLQVAFYGTSALTSFDLRLGPLRRVAEAASTLIVLNAAALVAFKNFVTGQKILWDPFPLTGKLR
jgi:poly-beta-1,6-N-acetyl-D-glucosamine synthase